MPVEMQGRRIPIDEKGNPYTALTQAGDYCGPISAYTNGAPAVFFLLPIARDENVPHGARSLHHVESPPHVFTENPDGSLTIRESIGAGPREGYYWHGFLNQGQWELTKRD